MRHILYPVRLSPSTSNTGNAAPWLGIMHVNSVYLLPGLTTRTLCIRGSTHSKPEYKCDRSAAERSSLDLSNFLYVTIEHLSRKVASRYCETSRLTSWEDICVRVSYSLEHRFRARHNSDELCFKCCSVVSFALTLEHLCFIKPTQWFKVKTTRLMTALFIDGA